MEYTVNKLAKMSGISTRTLHYYDEIGLLSPERISSNGYRIYGQLQVDLLQQILFFRELGLSLEEIKEIIYSKTFDQTLALENHLTALYRKKEQIDLLIRNVSKTIRAVKGEIIMGDKEKFEGFKQKLVEETEQKFGEEIRQKYGDKVVDASNGKVKNMTQEQYAKVEQLSKEVNETLREATLLGDPANELAQKACDLHRQWLCYFWPDGMYSKEAHKGLATMYCEDERFKAYYDAITPGCAEFLRDAIDIYCK
ncbi:MAG TPA: MerR family transcriptional regulator [Lachnoclostridium phytofermentans]|uniref:MerR family transcriptional regulator n=1 Tax=Lachnoclostridium phytofermentans TaxID=66219 RepID=A0A3D2X593_9FIRM|nr:MerR family transcriptional regulator [Lachnoclostridium phytofermentans]